MKKTIILICVVFYAVSTYAIPPKTAPVFVIEKSQPLKIKHLSGNITMSGGCVVHYEIDVDYSLFPLPHLNGVTGTVTMGASCSGTQTFSLRGSGETVQDQVSQFTTEEPIFTDPIRNKEFNIKMEQLINDEKLFDNK